MTADAQTSQCPVCHGLARSQFTVATYDIHRCGACDFLFVSPYPGPEVLSAYYNTQYRQTTDDYYPKAASRRRRSFGRALGLMPYIFGKRVLELGCGGGFMSWAMGLWAKSVVGVDLSEASIRYATRTFKKPTFLCQPMSEIGRQGETYDFVFSSELFEHLPGVDEVMDCIVRVTKPGSFVYVSAPDASHPRTPKDLASWIDICPPEHLQWFGRKSLALLFDQHGFDVHKFMHNPKPAHSALFRRR